MSLTHRIGQTYSSNNGSVASVAVTLVGDGEQVFDGVIPAGATNFQVNVAIDIAVVKSFVLYSSLATTVKTNSSTTPGDTLTIPAAGTIIWWTSAPHANPLSVAVTKLYVTNPGATDCVFKATALLDVTPSA